MSVVLSFDGADYLKSMDITETKENKMDLNKVYFVCETQAKRDFVKAVAGIKYPVSEFISTHNHLYIHGGKLHGAYECDEDTDNRTEASIEDLFKFALQGFRELWEVAPDGYRLVTDEEREEFAKPADYMTFHISAGVWKKGVFEGGPMNNQQVYAVPLDYDFRKSESERDIKVKSLRNAINALADELEQLIGED